MPQCEEREVGQFIYFVISGDYGEVAETAHNYFQRFDVRVYETQRLSTHELKNGDYEMIIRRLKTAKVLTVRVY